ncbi:class I SAM-dependent methyltransferase [Thermodesulfobacteriota bacterium]
MEKENAIQTSRPTAVACIAHHPDLQKMAEELAGKLGLPLVAAEERGETPLLYCTPQRLELHPPEKTGFGPIYVDFLGRSIRYRMQHGGGIRQLLARAAGIRTGFRPTVLDTTAGFGTDAFILATLGCRVLMIERSPIVAALLEDGLNRARRDPQVGPIVRTNLQLINTDSINYLSALDQPDLPHTIYLDPMFPLRGKKALVKKEMQMLQMLLNQDMDAPALLQAALSCGAERVVVKRPASAPTIAGPPPTTAIKSPKHRYDLYLR